MSKRSVLAGVCLTLVACVTLYLTSSALAEDFTGRYRVVRTNGTFVEGEIKEEGDKYVVTVKKGIVVSVAKNEVKAIKKLDEEAPKAAKADAKSDGKDPLEKTGDLSDDDIKKLLGEDDLGGDVVADEDVMPKLPTNEPSVAEMLRIASTQNKLETDHFVLVYTSSKEVARSLAARLESIYRWNYKFMKLMNLTPKRPKFKLEVYFFGEHKEFQAYQSNEGGTDVGVLGYFRYDKNRSCFFDMDTWPPIANAKEQLKQARDPQRRMKILNWIKRWKDFKNLEVIQHEAAHHIHFNMGVFVTDNDARPPRWLSEGLAMMFELPPTASGAGLATVNNSRLNEFQETYGNYFPRFPVPMRQFLIDDRLWFQGYNYPLGWAITNYLYRKYPDKFKTYMALMAAREEGVEIDQTKKQKEFEDLFGEVSDKWVADFFKFYMDQHVKKSELPPPLF